jgi:hypothetical protein
LARATTAFCQPERSFSACTHLLMGSLRWWAVCTTDLAPWISSVRREVAPRWVMAPSCLFAAGGALLGRQADPGAELCAALELLEVAHRGPRVPAQKSVF